MQRLAVVLFVLLVASTCATSSVQEDLRGRRFLVGDLDGYELPRGESMTFSFTAEGLGWGGLCNAHSGPYRVEADRIVVTEFGGTEEGCEDSVMDADSWVADFLRSGPRLSLDGDVLTLTGDDATIVARDTGERPGSVAEELGPE